MIIDESEKIRLAACDNGPVQRVAGPHLIRHGPPRTGRTPAAGYRLAGCSVPGARSAAGSSAPTATIRCWPAGSAATCAAVRAGFSRFSAAARPAPRRGPQGDLAGRRGQRVEPAARQARIHRSRLARDTRTGSPNGPACSRAASSRTTGPAGGWTARGQLPPGSACTGTTRPHGPAPHGGPPHHQQRSSPNLQDTAEIGVILLPATLPAPGGRRLAPAGVDPLRCPRRRQQQPPAHRAGQRVRRQAARQRGPAAARRLSRRSDRGHRVRGC